MRTRSRILSFGSAGVLILAGIGGAIAFGGTLGQVLALTLIGFGFVLATGLVFLEVGLSEDRERAREAAERAARGETTPRDIQARRLTRMRGSRRRLN